MPHTLMMSLVETKSGRQLFGFSEPPAEMVAIKKRKEGRMVGVSVGRRMNDLKRFKTNSNLGIKTIC